MVKFVNYINKYNTKYMIITLWAVCGFSYLLMGTKIFGLLSDFDSKYMLDLLLYYSGDKFLTTLADISVTQIDYYKLIHYIDYVFIMIFYPALACLLAKIIKVPNKLKFYILLPILAMICDFLENLIIDIHLSVGVSNFFAGLSGILTLFKFIFIGITIVVTFVLILKKIKDSKNNGQTEI
ncbi:hypothetical protein RJI07_02880 [Mycoplasmatota bacterium WC30]